VVKSPEKRGRKALWNLAPDQFGAKLRDAFPLPDDPSFDDLLDAIDRAEAIQRKNKRIDT
jgi:hypothetical protein